MTNVENINEEQLKAVRVVALGIIGALWKKKYRHTVIQYKDKLGSERAIVMDFHGNIERTKQLIYQKMLESKKDPSYLSIENHADSNFDRRETDSEVNDQPQQTHKQSNDELKHTLKMRLVWGEISI